MQLLLPSRNNLSEQWDFDVGNKVHKSSWGTSNCSSRTCGSSGSRWSSSDFIVQEKLGSGYFGPVVRAEYIRREDEEKMESPLCSRHVALKIFSKAKLLARHNRGKLSILMLQREVNIQSHMDHPHILQLYGFFEEPSRFNMCLEFAAQGDALQYMVRTEPQHRLRMASTILWQVCQALAYLECVHVAHRDIKPENILITGGRDLQAKLGDFGWAVWYRPGILRNTTLCGTAEYIPPEVLQPAPTRYMAEHVDVWMFGVLVVELMQGSTPFRPDDYNQPDSVIFKKIRSFESADQVELLPVAKFQDLVHSVLCKEPLERCPATKVMHHPFFSNMSRPSYQEKIPSVAQRRQLFQQT